MRARITATLTSLALVSSCATGSATSSGNEPEIFFSSQAEATAALAQFDAENPDCQLWTNWQKMCSRTGEDGQTLCQTTRQAGIKPSTPFCVAREDGGMRRAELSDGLSEIRSSLRFCEYPEGKPDDLAAQIETCVYSSSRPFNGRDLADRQHPWCETWNVAGEAKPASSSKPALHGLYCADRNVPQWCVWGDGFGLGPSAEMIQQIRRQEPLNEVIPTLLNVDSLPVNGVFCRRRTD